MLRYSRPIAVGLITKYIFCQREIPINIDNQHTYLEVRNKIVQEIATRAILLFGRWNGVEPKSSPDSEHLPDTHKLRSKLWNRVPPTVPEGASSVTIRAECEGKAQKVQKLIKEVTGHIGICDGSTLTVGFNKPEFEEIWKICVDHKIPPMSLTF